MRMLHEKHEADGVENSAAYEIMNKHMKEAKQAAVEAAKNALELDKSTMALRSGQRIKRVTQSLKGGLYSEDDALQMTLKISETMSVAPRGAPSTSDRSKTLSRRGSRRDEEELAVGAVVVMLSDKSGDQSAAAYSFPSGGNSHHDAKFIPATTSQKDPRFVAVLAPSCEAAMTSLLTQPPGTFLLVKEEDAAIAVYVKFRQAVRALALVKGKDVKKTGDAVQLAKLRKKEQDVTPVHILRLASNPI
ncbi:hypothetical protein PInf_014741 [Phytophthora infestans]|nr:hypothetical protein PInf_014741 [Phytophthora infestans]